MTLVTSPTSSSVTAPTTSASGNAPSTPCTLDEVNVENAARISRNHALQSRRNAGEPNVPSDEPLLSPPAPSPPSVSTTSLAQQWMVAFSTMSLNSKAQAKKAFGALATTETSFPVTAASTPKIYYSDDSEVLSSVPLDSTFGLGIHSTITDLADAKQYLPLILFTDESTKRLHCEGHTLKKVKLSIAGMTFHLIDLSTFPAESSLDIFHMERGLEEVSPLAQGCLSDTCL